MRAVSLTRNEASYLRGAATGEARDTDTRSAPAPIGRAKVGITNANRKRANASPLLSLNHWIKVLSRTYLGCSQDQIFLIAAGVAFFGLLALVPALTALISIAGFFVDPERIVDQLQNFSSFLPEGALSIIGAQMQRVASQPTNRLSFAFAASVGVALWSANTAIKAIFGALNAVYGGEAERTFLRNTFISLLFTLGAIGTVILALGVIIVVPGIMSLFGLGGVARTLIAWGRWPFLFAMIVTWISLLYRFGPSRRPVQHHWISPGSLVAASLWVAASALFSWYVSNFSTYNETYGSLGAVIAFMIWLWISASIILLGAELDSALVQAEEDESGAER